MSYAYGKYTYSNLEYTFPHVLWTQREFKHRADKIEAINSNTNQNHVN
jgi:hypothetical protein